jgi:spermidine/putrescine transport system permease protein
VSAEAAGAARGARRRARRSTLGLLAAPLLWLVLFFLVPVAFVAAYSVGSVRVLPTDAAVGLGDWTRFLGGESIYLGLFWKSVRVSLTVSTVVVLLAYPVAYFLALCARKRKYVLLLVIIAPFLTSYLLRVLAWKVILGDRGVINSALYQLHLRQPGDPVEWLIYSQFAVMLVLAYVWVPFVALPIFVSLNNLDPSYLEAAGDLGASRWRTFWRVTLPLSLPGLTAAFVFVFVPTIGEFVTPQIVGGSSDGSNFLFGNAINARFTQALDWQSGSVQALFLLIVVAVLMAIFGRRLSVRTAAV